MPGPEKSFADGLDGLATRSSLVVRLKSWNDHKGWTTFFDTYWKLLYCVAVKAGLSDAEARDVVQETMIAVARNMQKGHFEHRHGSFRSWLLKILHRRVIDQFRKRHPRAECLTFGQEGSSRTPLVERMPAPSDGLKEIWDEEWPRNLSDAALQRVKERVAARQYQLFDLYAVKGRPAREVARLLRVNVAQVYLAKYRVTALVKKEIRNLETEANQLFHSKDSR
ncbi:MAG: RNA polymerase sigma factor [Verrucomicrobiia bacterium]